METVLFEIFIAVEDYKSLFQFLAFIGKSCSQVSFFASLKSFSAISKEIFRNEFQIELIPIYSSVTLSGDQKKTYDYPLTFHDDILIYGYQNVFNDNFFSIEDSTHVNLSFYTDGFRISTLKKSKKITLKKLQQKEQNSTFELNTIQIESLPLKFILNIVNLLIGDYDSINSNISIKFTLKEKEIINGEWTRLGFSDNQAFSSITFIIQDEKYTFDTEYLLLFQKIFQDQLVSFYQKDNNSMILKAGKITILAKLV